MSEISETAAELNASQMLSEARVAMGLSQEEVAQELFLIPNYIRLIDSGDIEKIDKQAFVRGYLRSYARLVDLDGDDMVARYERTKGTRPQIIEVRRVTQESVGSTNFTGPVIQTAVIGLVGLVIVISLVWFLLVSSDEEPVAVTSNQSAINEPAVQSRGVSVSSADLAPVVDETDPAQLTQNTDDLVDVAEDQNTDILSTDVSIADDATVNVSNIVSLAQEQPPGVQVDLESSVIQVDAGGEDELRFTFTGECWVEIEDGEGKSIYGDLNRSGDELLVRGIAPFEVLFGKAPAVTMSYNGEAFDLEPHITSVDTAKVRVGS